MGCYDGYISVSFTVIWVFYDDYISVKFLPSLEQILVNNQLNTKVIRLVLKQTHI